MSYELTLYVYPSPFGVDWRSPHHLTRSVMLNALTFKPRTIGHVSVELKGPDTDILTGMASEDFRLNHKLIFWDHLALGVLFYWYPGVIEQREDLIPEKLKRLQKGNFSFIKFKLSQESFEKAKQYLVEYDQRKAWKWYGFPPRPRHGEGAGCTAFGMSVLEVAGILSPEFEKHWSGVVRVPEELIGEKEGKKVPVWKILLPTEKSTRWARADEPGRELSFWDPDMIHSWVLKNQNAKELNAHGVILDVSSKKPQNDPIWLDER